MTHLFNDTIYYSSLIGVLGLLLGWLLTKLFLDRGWKSHCKTLEAKNESTLSLLDETEVNVVKLDSIVVELRAKLALLENDNRTLVKAFTSLQEKKKLLIKELGLSSQKLKVADDVNHDLANKNSNLIKKLDIVVKEKSNFNDLETIISDLNSSNTNLRKDLYKAENRIKQNQAPLTEPVTQTHHLNLNRKESSADNNTQLLNKQITSLTSERDQLIKNVHQYSSEKLSEKYEIKTLNDKLNTLQADKTKLTNKLTMIKQKTEKLADLEKKFASLECKEITSNLNESQQLTQINKLEKEFSKYKDASCSEIKRHHGYLLKVETQWAKKLYSLNSQLDKERQNHEMELEKARLKLENSVTVPTVDFDPSDTPQSSQQLVKLPDPENSSKKKSINLKSKQIKIEHPEINNNKSDKKLQHGTLKKSMLPKNAAEETKTEINSNILKTSRSNKINKTDDIRYPIESIEGIGVVYGKRLRNIKVDFVDTLLNKGKKPKGRLSLANRTDIDKSLISTWVNHADLFRIDGIEGDNAGLLIAADINNVEELQCSNANQLTQKLINLNTDQKLIPKTPDEDEVSQWISHASLLKPMVEYEFIKPSVEESSKQVKVDDLTKIKGIGKINEKILHSQGITTFAQIAEFTKQDEKKYGEKLSSFHDRISQEKWVKQAKKLQNKRPNL